MAMVIVFVKLELEVLDFEIGDKFSSTRAAETVGMVYNSMTRHHLKDGIIPDIIINPHAIPSNDYCSTN